MLLNIIILLSILLIVIFIVAPIKYGRIRIQGKKLTVSLFAFFELTLIIINVLLESGLVKSLIIAILAIISSIIIWNSKLDSISNKKRSHRNMLLDICVAVTLVNIGIILASFN